MRDRTADELAEEMRFHQELRAEQLRRDGVPPDEALAAAHRQFGHNITLQEASRAMWGFGSIDEIRQDLRYASRRLRQRPGFALSVVGVLALGIGATTAMFSAVDAAMLRPLPFHQPARLAVLPNVQIGSDMRDVRFPADKHLVYIDDVRAMRDLFSDVAAFASGGLNLSDPERPVRVKVGVVTANLFSTLGVTPVRGRAFNPAEGAPDGQSAVMLSWRIWQQQYGAARMEGKTIQLNGKPYTVVGVMPEGFSFPSESDLWIPLTVPTTSSTYEPFRGYLPSAIIARVMPAIAMQDASARLTTRWEQAAFGASTSGRRSIAEDVVKEVKSTGAVLPLQRELVGDRRNALLMLLGATGLLLLIACANVTNLLLSQSAARGREMAVREVLGASRGRVVRQLLTESVLLALGGALLGIGVAPLALELIGSITPTQLAGLAPARLDLRVLAFATILGLTTGIAFGIWPAFGSTRRAPGEIIKAGSRNATAAAAGRLRRVLVGAEIALTLILLVGAGLMLRSFGAVMQINTGMHAEQVATVQLSFARSEGGRADRLGRIEQMLQNLGATPGVSHAAVVNDLPLRDNGGISLSVVIDGVVPAKGKEMLFARWLQVSNGYFATLGIPMLRGRDFTALDDSLAPRVAIINNAMASEFWRGVDPIGRTFHMPGDSVPVTVVGIVADVRESGLEDSPRPQMYRPVTETTPSNLALIARGSLEPAQLLAQLTAAVRAVDPAQATYDLRMMDEVVGRSKATRRTGTLLITAFAGLALILAALGVYAVVSYGVSQRMRELGIRAALGATGYDLLGLLMREMAWVTAIGIAAGLAGAWLLTRVIASQLYGVEVHDPATFAVVPLVLALASAAATLVPARRTFRVNPAEIIRSD
ncbi:MAG: ABC transporter permease [Gemmatimonadota bacterium]